MAIAQVLGSTVDGLVLSTAVLYFSLHIGIPAATIGIVLACGAALALVLSVPIGLLADALGLRTAAIALSILAATALVVYASATGIVLYVVGALCFLVGQSGLGAVRQALVSSSVEPEGRVRARAVMHTLLNTGMGLGTVIGALVILVDRPELYVIVFLVGAGAAVVCGAILFGLQRVAREPSLAAARRPGIVALRDGRFMAVTALTALLQLTLPVLSVVLPLWVVQRTGAPEWIAAVGFALNTVIVICVQTPWATRLRTDRDAARSALIAGVGLVGACLLIALAGSTASPLLAALSVLFGVALLTVGEIGGGAAAWHLAFRDSPAALQGQYQATFGMSSSVARILGPLLVLPLILAVGLPGWIALAAVFAVAAGGIALIAARRHNVEPAAG